MLIAAPRRHRFARKDRRPLDPPPVVQVRFFEVVHFGTPAQFERELTAYELVPSRPFLDNFSLTAGLATHSFSVSSVKSIFFRSRRSSRQTAL